MSPRGLIKSNRNQGNQRRYPREVLRRVALIKVAQRLGIPLAEIGEALKALPDNRAPTAADWKDMSAQWGRDLDERINQLTLLRDKLNGCIGCGCLSMEACPLRNYGDVLGEQGPGRSCWNREYDPKNELSPFGAAASFDRVPAGQLGLMWERASSRRRPSIDEI